MRRIVFYLATGTNKRQYEEMTTKIQTQYRERIFPAIQTYVGGGMPELEFATWNWVNDRKSDTGLIFWVAAPWGTGSTEDIVLDAMLTQHLELSIIPIVYWDDVRIEWHSHDCTYDISECSVCTNEEWDWDNIDTRSANDMLASTLPNYHSN